jgi:hypothetical protein
MQKLIGDLRVIDRPINAHASIQSTLRNMVDPMVETTRMLSHASIEPRPGNLYPNVYSAASPQPRAAPVQAAAKTNEANFEHWRQRSLQNPILEIIIDKAPIFLASHRNFLFVVDEKDMLSLFTMDSSNKFNHENNFKIPIPKLRAIAASQNYFGVTFSELEPKQLKNKRYKQNGVVLFARDLSIINFTGEIIYELKNGEAFVAPIGIAINDESLFVCDKALKAVFKFNLKTKEVTNRINMDGGGEPYKLSVNRDFLVVTDPVTHLLKLFNANTFALIKNLAIDQPDKRNGPFTVAITSDNIIFFKNYAESQLTFVDMNLSNEQVFTRITENIQGFTILENGHSQTLVIGCTDKKNNFKLVCFKNF